MAREQIEKIKRKADEQNMLVQRNDRRKYNEELQTQKRHLARELQELQDNVVYVKAKDQKEVRKRIKAMKRKLTEIEDEITLISSQKSDGAAFPPAKYANRNVTAQAWGMQQQVTEKTAKGMRNADQALDFWCGLQSDNAFYAESVAGPSGSSAPTAPAAAPSCFIVRVGIDTTPMPATPSGGGTRAVRALASASSILPVRLNLSVQAAPDTASLGVPARDGGGSGAAPAGPSEGRKGKGRNAAVFTTTSTNMDTAWTGAGDAIENDLSVGEEVWMFNPYFGYTRLRTANERDAPFCDGEVENDDRARSFPSTIPLVHTLHTYHLPQHDAHVHAVHVLRSGLCRCGHPRAQ